MVLLHFSARCLPADRQGEAQVTGGGLQPPLERPLPPCSCCPGLCQPGGGWVLWKSVTAPHGMCVNSSNPAEPWARGRGSGVPGRAGVGVWACPAGWAGEPGLPGVVLTSEQRCCSPPASRHPVAPRISPCLASSHVSSEEGI